MSSSRSSYPLVSRTDAFSYPIFFPPKYPVVSEGAKKTIKYLRRTVVALAELRLGSTFEHVSSSVKSRRLVPCMWTSETRLHKGLRSRRRRHYLSTAPCFHQQSEAARACMTSVGMWGKKCALLIGSNGRRGRSRGGSRRGIDQ